ncbi:MAG: hypothetical protein GF363_05225 [Chitinivibrionales bacterium]|nr:hypothetical protein [Chitinivibrionales bacterium]
MRCLRMPKEPGVYGFTGQRGVHTYRLGNFPQRGTTMHPRLTKKAIWTVSLCALSFSVVFGRTFYVDPHRGSATGDGSREQPWRTLDQVIDDNLIQTQAPSNGGRHLVLKNGGAPVRGGDTLLLRDGYHGAVKIEDAYNMATITIAAQTGHQPCLSSLHFAAAARWKVSGLHISPEHASRYQKRTLVYIESKRSGPGREIVVENCRLQSIAEASRWSSADWNARACHGTDIRSPRVIFRGNYLRNMDFAIMVSGDSCLVEGNTVENFAGDGIRGLGDYCTYKHNTIMNCYDVNANHDDGFQSWSVGEHGVGTGVVKGVKVIGNTIINNTDPHQPHRGTLQGIGCFDGYFEDWVIENNAIIVDNYHGVTFRGAVNCRIVNNTILDINTDRPGPAWVGILKPKDGTPSLGCIVRNNILMNLNIERGCEAVIDHNIVERNPQNFFVDYHGFDLRLRPGCKAIDAGSPAAAPAVDISGIARPFGRGVDIGAHEYKPMPLREMPRGGIAPPMRNRSHPASASSRPVTVDGRRMGNSAGNSPAAGVRIRPGHSVVRGSASVRMRSDR